MATNFEHYKEEILEITKSGCNFAVIEDEVVPCAFHICEGCDLKRGNCAIGRIKFLYAEHIEKPKLTKAERMLLEIIKGKYVARQKSGTVFAYINKPWKDKYSWRGEPVCTRFDAFVNVDFPFIKWEDDEPWSVEELLKLEVKE